MTWAAILALGIGTYAMKAVGPVVLGSRMLPDWLQQVFTLVAVTLLASLVAINTLVAGRSITLDGRIAGLAVAVVCLWCRAPFIVVVIAAAVTAATVRAVGLGA